MRDHYDENGRCRWGLIFGRGAQTRQVCYRHATEGQRALVETLDVRAPEIGLKKVPAIRASWGGGYVWPYGPNLYVDDRVALLDWAIPNQLRISNAVTTCPEHWITGRSCPSYGSYTPGWIDHPSRWNHNGKPRVLVCQPYSLSDKERAEVEGLVAAANGAGRNLRLEISEESGWYGKPTIWVAIWNEANR